MRSTYKSASKLTTAPNLHYSGKLFYLSNSFRQNFYSSGKRTAQRQTHLPSGKRTAPAANAPHDNNPLLLPSSKRTTPAANAPPQRQTHRPNGKRTAPYPIL